MDTITSNIAAIDAAPDAVEQSFDIVARQDKTEADVTALRSRCRRGEGTRRPDQPRRSPPGDCRPRRQRHARGERLRRRLSAPRFDRADQVAQHAGSHRWRLCRAAGDRRDDRPRTAGNQPDPRHRAGRADRQRRLSQAGVDRRHGQRLGHRNGGSPGNRHARIRRNRPADGRALRQSSGQPGDARRCRLRSRKLAGERDRDGICPRRRRCIRQRHGHRPAGRFPVGTVLHSR